MSGRISKCGVSQTLHYGTIKQYKYLNEQVQRAKDDLSAKRSILCKDFNIRTTTEEKWLDFDTINNEATFELSELRGSYGIGGVDLSAVNDLTCASILVEKKGRRYLIQQYFMPKDKLEEKNKDDKVPYDVWAERGLVTLCEGNRVNPQDVTEWFLKMHRENDISAYWVGYDRWEAKYWVEQMKECSFAMEEVIQGAKTFSMPMKELEADLRGKKLNYNNNPITKWCLLNTSIETDKNENIRPIKRKE